jgi:hypothetical protein
MRPLMIALGIVGFVLLTAFGACGYLVYRGSQAMGLRVSGSAPADFPVYPGAVQRSAVSMSPQGAHTAITQIQWATTASPDKVREYYMTRLDQGDWEITASTSTLIRFRRRSRPDTSTGRLVVTPSLGQSIFQAQFEERSQ